MRPGLLALDLETGDDVLLAGDEDPDVRWVAEFIAAEEMERRRGHWWAPGGERLSRAASTDRPVQVRHIASPIEAAAAPEPTTVSAGGYVERDRDAARAGDQGAPRSTRRGTATRSIRRRRSSWTEEGPPLARAIARSTGRAGAGDRPDTGTTEVVWRTATDGRTSPGVPAWLPGDRLLTAGHRDDTRLLLIDDEPATPPACRSTACSTPATRCGSPEPESRPSCTCGGDRRRVGGTGERRQRQRSAVIPEISACW